MGRSYPLDLIPDQQQARIPADQVPVGPHMAVIESLVPTSSRQGNFMINGTFRLAEPSPAVGYPLYEYYTIGTPNDKDAEDPDTWKNSLGAARLKRLFTRARVPATGRDIDADCALAAGKPLVIDVQREVEPAKKDGEPNPYAGKVRNRVAEVWSVGERQPIGAKAVAGGSDAPRLHCPIPGCTAGPLSTAEYGPHVATGHSA